MNGQATDYSAAFRQCLVDLDIALMRKLWKHVAPQMPQPQSDADCVVSMHMARTRTQSIPFRARAWSHRWLTERALPSGLPDMLRPRAERLYPVIADAVGVSVLATHSTHEGKRALGGMVRDVMNSVVMDHYSSDKPRDPARIKSDMLRQRADFWRRIASASAGWRR